ncbi:hypothetical protein HHI36_019678 [Cryptolaemus montrouzieri]|uniref:Endoplasmic reticulum transmembrane protein n=1 Tax=Cryptolaemus montrouzieri TaxID=559131 RepID=A0ABD2N851_9CUCU
MSSPWTWIRGFLYVEIAIVLLLVLPIASLELWYSLLQSKFLQDLKSQTDIYFIILLAILVLFGLDAIRKIRQYSHLEKNIDVHSDYKMLGSLKLFRAQQNFYIFFLSLLLSLVIRQLIMLNYSQAQYEASVKQAKSALSATEKFLVDQGNITENTRNNVTHDEGISILKSESEKLKEELKTAEKVKSLNSQNNNLVKGYYRLAEAHSKLQERVTIGSADEKENVNVMILKSEIMKLTEKLKVCDEHTSALKLQADYCDKEYRYRLAECMAAMIRI